MTPLSRNVLLAGLALVVAGLVFAFIIGIYVDHEARLAAYDAYGPTFRAIIEDASRSEWQEELAQANRTSMAQRYAATVHTHGTNMGILLILVGLLTPLLAQLRKQSPWLLWAMTGAAWVYPLGLFFKFAGRTQLGETLAALGAALAIVALAWLFVSVSRAIEKIARS